MIGRSLLAIVGLLAALGGPVAHGHEGHDHDKPAPLNVPVAPRVVAVTPDLELVGVSSGQGRLTIFLHSFATNEPIRDARLSVTAGTDNQAAEPRGEGVFTLSAPWLATAEGIDLVFSLTLSDGTQDLLTGRLQNASSSAPIVVAESGSWRAISRLKAQPELVILVLASLMAGVLISLLIPSIRARWRDTITSGEPEAERLQQAIETSSESRRVTRLRRGMGVSAVICVFGLLSGTNGFAAGPSAQELPSVPATMATDLAQRTPDGTLFVPKATQHLLSVRTMLTARGAAARTAELTGTIIAGPENFGRVQPGRPGRIEAAPGGLAHIGKRVEKGALLGYVLSYVEAADRANMNSVMAETEARIAKNRTILSRYENSPGAVPQVRVDEVHGELEALIRKRAELLPSSSTREPILAPISGVVSVANATIGQVVEARDVLFEIVDPSQFWVEAYGHGQETQALQTLTAAHAIVGGITRVPIEFAGRGHALRNQATVLTFKISGRFEDLSIGMPVRVVLQSATKVEGFIVPSSAIVRGQTGLPIVWVKTEPERFEPLTVKVEPLDGNSVVVTSGLKEDQRIVTDGVTLLNQIR